MGGDALWLSSSAGNAVMRWQEPVHWHCCPQWALGWILGELRVSLSACLVTCCNPCSRSVIPEEIPTPCVFWIKIATLWNFVLEEGRLWERRELLLPASATGLSSCLALLVAHCHHPLLQSHPERTGWSFEGSKKPTSCPPIPACPQWYSTTPCQSGPFPHTAVIAESSSCTHCF